MPNPFAPLWDHNARPTRTSQLNIHSVSHNGRRHLAAATFVSSLVPQGPGPMPARRTLVEFFPMPLEDDMDIDMAEPDALDASAPPATIAGVEGINVLPKAKAKRYENSVSVLKNASNVLSVNNADRMPP